MPRRASSSVTSSSQSPTPGRPPVAWRWSASASSPASRTSSPATPPIISSRRSTSWACATAPARSSVAVRALVQHLDGPIENLNPPVIWERGVAGTTPPFSRPGYSVIFSGGHRPRQCVERSTHAAAVKARRVTSNATLARRFIQRAQSPLHMLGLGSTARSGRRGRVSPRDVDIPCRTRRPG